MKVKVTSNAKALIVLKNNKGEQKNLLSGKSITFDGSVYPQWQTSIGIFYNSGMVKLEEIKKGSKPKDPPADEVIEKTDEVIEKTDAVVKKVAKKVSKKAAKKKVAKKSNTGRSAKRTRKNT